MGKATGPTNPNLSKLIQDLKLLSFKEKVNIWKSIAKELEKPTRRRRSVNLSKIDRYSKDNETIIVPGKVLGSGALSKNITIAAFQFSESAKKKLKHFMIINELMKKFFDSKNIILVDFKLEFGRYKGKIILADEISPDTCRLWDKTTKEKLDKDRFRRDLGNVEGAYQEVLRRVMG
jgi:ribosomal protein L18E